MMWLSELNVASGSLYQFDFKLFLNERRSQSQEVLSGTDTEAIGRDQ